MRLLRCLPVALVMFPLNFLWVGQSPVACGGKFPAVRPARTALCMDAQGAAHRQAPTNPVGLPCVRNPADVPEPASMPHLPGVLTPPRMPEPPCQPGAQGAANPPVMPEQWEGANPPVMPALKGSANPLCIRNPAVALRPPDGIEPARRKSLLSKAALGIAFCVLAAMLAYDIVTEGVAVGVTKAVGFVLLILVAALGSRLGYLKF